MARKGAVNTSEAIEKAKAERALKQKARAEREAKKQAEVVVEGDVMSSVSLCVSGSQKAKRESESSGFI